WRRAFLISSILVESRASSKARSMMFGVCMEDPRKFRSRHERTVAHIRSGLVVLQILQPARPAFLRRIGRDRLDLRLLWLARFLARSHLTLGHAHPPPERRRLAIIIASRDSAAPTFLLSQTASCASARCTVRQPLSQEHAPSV